MTNEVFNFRMLASGHWAGCNIDGVFVSEETVETQERRNLRFKHLNWRKATASEAQEWRDAEND
jgi:hypothetical protein